LLRCPVASRYYITILLVCQIGKDNEKTDAQPSHVGWGKKAIAAFYCANFLPSRLSDLFATGERDHVLLITYASVAHICTNVKSRQVPFGIRAQAIDSDPVLC
jgi:hypothetical protein